MVSFRLYVDNTVLSGGLVSMEKVHTIRRTIKCLVYGHYEV